MKADQARSRYGVLAFSLLCIPLCHPCYQLIPRYEVHLIIRCSSNWMTIHGVHHCVGAGLGLDLGVKSLITWLVSQYKVGIIAFQVTSLLGSRLMVCKLLHIPNPTDHNPRRLFSTSIFLLNSQNSSFDRFPIYCAVSKALALLEIEISRTTNAMRLIKPNNNAHANIFSESLPVVVRKPMNDIIIKMKSSVSPWFTDIMDNFQVCEIVLAMDLVGVSEKKKRYSRSCEEIAWVVSDK